MVLTMLLTMAAYKFSVASSLPPVSYLTFADCYVLLCFMCILLLALECVAAAKFGSDFDVPAMVGVAAVWVTVNVSCVVSVRCCSGADRPVNPPSSLAMRTARTSPNKSRMMSVMPS